MRVYEINLCMNWGEEWYDHWAMKPFMVGTIDLRSIDWRLLSQIKPPNLVFNHINGESEVTV